jgi:putative transposase
VVSPQAWREAVAFACERGLSERRACGLIDISRSCLSYELRLPAKDAPVIEAMKTLSSQYPRYGYRRIRIFLRRAGHELGVHRTHRLWRQAGLQLPRRRPRRRIATGRPRPLPAVNANFLWAYDFVFDATATGQQIKCLTVVDEFTRECLAIDVAGSIRSRRVIESCRAWSACTARRTTSARTTARFVARRSCAGSAANIEPPDRSRQALAGAGESSASSATSA